MGKRRFFLGFLTVLVVSFFSGVVHAAGYTCDKTYTTCASGYYLDSGNCKPCGAVTHEGTISNIPIDNGTRVLKCNNGAYTGGTAGNKGAADQCTGCSENAQVYSCECNTGYHSTGSGANCECTQNCQSDCSYGIEQSYSQTITGGTLTGKQTCTATKDGVDGCWTWSDASNLSAICDNGYYSTGPSCSSCTNKPNNSYYTGSATSNSCPWSCNTDYGKVNASDADCSKFCPYQKNSSSLYSSSISNGTKRWVCNGNYTGSTDGECTGCSQQKIVCECDSGYYSTEGNDCKCEKATLSCPKGQYVSGDTCLNCPSGSYCPGDTAQPQECNVGWYSDGATQCQQCTNTIPENAEYFSNSNANDCTWECKDGYNQSGNTCVEVACSTGQYLSGSSCYNCSNKPNYAYYTGSATSNSCPWACNAGYYKDNGSCTICPAGKLCPAGEDPRDCPTDVATRKPDNAHYHSGQGAKTICEWECDGGYHLNEWQNGCELNTTCSESKPCSSLGEGYTGGNYNECTGNASDVCYRPCDYYGNDACPDPDNTTCTHYAQQYFYPQAGTTCSVFQVTCKDSSKYWNGTACVSSCTNTCTSTNNTTSTQSCTPACSVANGTCSYTANSGSQTCNGKYEGGNNCTVGCSGCTSWGTCTGGSGLSVSCNAGYYWNGSACVACGGNGYYCPGFKDVNSPTNGYGRNTVTAGYYSTGDDANTRTGQSQCTGATYCSGGVKRDCPSGYTANTAKGKTAAEQCQISVSAGKYIKTENTSTQEPCSAGTAKAAHTVNYGSTSSCDPCTGNTYSTGGAASCTACTNGYTIRDNNRTSAAQCKIDCAAGTRVAVANAGCTTPAGNWYTDAAHTVAQGSTSPDGTVVKSCPASYNISGTATTDHDNKNDCKINCTAGTRVVTADAACTTPTGSWYTGAHTVAAGSTSTVSSCNTNYATPNTTTATNHDNVNDCSITCQAGYYIETAGAGCKACSPGKYCNGGTKNQLETLGVTGDCPAGTYSTGGATNSACTAALTGYTATVCATDKYSDVGASSCTNCATGLGYHNSGNTANDHAGIASCKVSCAGNQYVATAGGGCLSVGTGYYGRATASTLVSQNATLGRTQCPANYRVGPATDTECKCQTACAAKTYVKTAKAGCEATPVGSYSAAHNVEYCKTSNHDTNNPIMKSCPVNYQAIVADSEANCETHCDGTYVATAKAACTNVGVGYYREPHNVKYGQTSARKACPNLGDNIGVTTKVTNANSVEMCYLADVWNAPDANTGLRRNCYHNNNANETNAEAGYVRACTDEKIVACAGGYYDNGSTTKSDSTSASGKTRICAQITDKDSYSPAQSSFTNELAKPARANPGSSTILHSCPAQVEVPMDKPNKLGIKRRTFNTPWAASDYDKCVYPAGQCYNDLYTYDNSLEICKFGDPNRCPEGFYCPTGASDPILCPTDKSGRRGVSDGGSTVVTECYIVYDPYAPFQKGTGRATCHYKSADSDYTNCEVTAKTCNAGYYYKSPGSSTCAAVEVGYYSPAPNLTQTECPPDWTGSNELASNWSNCYKSCTVTVPHSATVAAKESRVYGSSATTWAACSYSVTCQTGYTPTNNNTETPSCTANTYTVTLDKNGGAGNTPASIQCTFNSGACTLPATSGITRTGYTVGLQWCTESNGKGTCYTGGSTITGNISATGSNITLYAIWTPIVYKVTLKQPDAVIQSVPTEVYLKYASGWFADKSATLPLNDLATTPTKTGYNFAGFVANNGIQVVASNGAFLLTPAAMTFTSADTDVTVRWSADNTTCPAGTYYAGTGSTCQSCPDNSYCPGGKFATDAGTDGVSACRDGGKTAVNAHATSETQCFKEDLPTYVGEHGTGKQTCSFNDKTLKYDANCRNKYITACEAGYWLANTESGLDKPDCVPVGNGYYSPEAAMGRTQCPNSGTTNIQTATSIQDCFKTGLPYEAIYGSGTQTCYYSYGEGTNAVYARDCPDESKEIKECKGGYWLNKTITKLDCSEVDFNYYSETNDIERHACEGGGTTASATTSTKYECKRDDEKYTADHGGGKRVCYYTSGEGTNAKYTTSCGKPSFDYCNDGYYYEPSMDDMDCVPAGYGYYSPYPSKLRTMCGLDEDGLVMTTKTPTSANVAACITCPANTVCADPEGSNPPQPQSCEILTGTKDYIYADKGTTNVKQCYRVCKKGDHVTETSGHDYYGGINTCMPSKCEAGYQVQGDKCVSCPEGSFCLAPGADDPGCEPGGTCGATSCASLGDGSWKYSAKGAKEAKQCYRKCEQYSLEGGKAVPRETTVYWNNMCIYDGYDLVGNPCEIVDDKCVVKMCKNSYEMINGKCEPCNRENALTYKSGGNCIVETCRANFHPYGDKCVSDTVECPAPNAARAEMRWNSKTNAFGVCTITECDAGFHISSNACVADVQECTVEHGRGEREWNHKSNTWGDCIATYCEPGFTNDPSESNEPTKQCGNCKNKFGVGGELAASTYSRGCTISACMYQGEMYNLENNECNPICSVTGYEDETGTMKWNSKTHKCERNCKDGYSMW